MDCITALSLAPAVDVGPPQTMPVLHGPFVDSVSIVGTKDDDSEPENDNENEPTVNTLESAIDDARLLWALTSPDSGGVRIQAETEPGKNNKCAPLTVSYPDGGFTTWVSDLAQWAGQVEDCPVWCASLRTLLNTCAGEDLAVAALLADVPPAPVTPDTFLGSRDEDIDSGTNYKTFQSLQAGPVPFVRLPFKLPHLVLHQLGKTVTALIGYHKSSTWFIVDGDTGKVAASRSLARLLYQ